ncbi:MAG: beta-lactamase family protein [Gammaproteobacteria bacterium]|nr:beta-lactamase family protein [Gammaproteobacteria bacterium]
MTAALLLVALIASGPSDLQAVLDRVRDAQNVPGISAVVIRNNEVIFAGASGVADLETARPMTADTVMYMGSLSKILTAVLALQLVESDKLALEDAVAGIAIESETDTSTIRVTHLLTHSAGLEREGDFGYWFTADFPDSTSLAQYLANTRLRFRPGTNLHYSNVGYAALGRVIEQASDQSYGDALRERVLEPLEMTATGVAGSDASVSSGYTPPGRIIPSEERPFAGVGRQVGTRHVRMYHNARAMSPAFGIYTSARDLGRLALFLLGKGGDSVLSQAMRTRMHERQASGWGLGLKIQRNNGRLLARHDGWFAAHRSHMLLDIDEGVAVAVQANSDNAATGKIADALLKAARE